MRVYTLKGRWAVAVEYIINALDESLLTKLKNHEIDENKKRNINAVTI